MAATVLYQISMQTFITSLINLKIPTLSEQEIKKAASFLSISTPSETSGPVVTLAVFLHYMRRVQTKDQFLLLTDYKTLNREVLILLSKENEIR